MEAGVASGAGPARHRLSTCGLQRAQLGQDELSIIVGIAQRGGPAQDLPVLKTICPPLPQSPQLLHSPRDVGEGMFPHPFT